MINGKESISTRAKRPAGIIGLAVIFSLISLTHLFKFWQATLHWRLITELNSRVSPYYPAGDGLLWFVIALSLAWGLWNAKRWARPASQIASIFYCLEFWGDKIWIANPESLIRHWPFMLLITILGICLILSILKHKTSRDYFGVNPVKIPNKVQL